MNRIKTSRHFSIRPMIVILPKIRIELLRNAITDVFLYCCYCTLLFSYASLELPVDIVIILPLGDFIGSCLSSAPKIFIT